MENGIIYVGDPMCSWCWGFSPVLNKIRHKYSSKVKFSVLVGGLRSGGSNPMDPSLRETIGQHWHEVIRRTGQEFSFGILQQKDFVYNTEPSCRAVVAIRHLAPEAVFDYFDALHRAFYSESRDITQPDVLAEIAGKFGAAEGDFMQTFASSEIKQETTDDFLYARRIGVMGFPSLLYKDMQGYLPITKGYQGFETLDPKIADLLQRGDENPYFDG